MIILSMFREEPVEGKPGPVSMRRVLAFFLVLSAVGLFAFGFYFEKDSWYVFLPGIVCICGGILLMLFTTWEDVKEILTAAAGVKKS